jgi:hypothetical protein
MDRDGVPPGVEDPNIIADFTSMQMQHFRESDPRCRALQLPEGIMLRYTLSEALFFYLRTGVKDGKIQTKVYASDSPYDRLKTAIGDVITPMFQAEADVNHFKKLKGLLHSWVDFVKRDPDAVEGFQSFEVHDRPE